jgi:hypothetical protein
MTDLLVLALRAHGGVDRWRGVSSIRTRASASGLFFASKGYGDALRNVGVTVRRREQWTSLEPFTDVRKRAVCTPSRTVIATQGKQLEDTRDDPLLAFTGHSADTRWDDLHLAYFIDYAITSMSHSIREFSRSPSTS